MQATLRGSGIVKRYTIIILTGLSGSGKTTALGALEDSGYYCVDNMPVELLPKLLALPIKRTTRMAGFAFVMDLRDKALLSNYTRVFESLMEKGYRYELVFLEADETILLRRFSQTRRPHPISVSDRLIDNIRSEKERLEGLRKAAHRIIDTSSYSFHQLKQEMITLATTSNGGNGLRINVLSFGFKYGIPTGADLVADVRFLQNPYFVKELEPLSGRDVNVQSYVIENEPASVFLEKYLSLLEFLIPLYQSEGKSYLTIAIGCTGGRHRSVAVATRLQEDLKTITGNSISITHRDIDL